ncbi:MAG: 6-bladed beta-propeller [Gemmatimonadota bacterium]|nr:6-bladed beta-propeller [Gemmatimonadota bacterium]MDE2984554.1 6-bladed beta-propeller [Gemmatimonadota bacterium]
MPEARDRLALGGLGAPGDSTHLIWSIIQAVPLSDGRIVMLAPEGDTKVLVFEPSGRLSESFGRAGQGPGEFHYPIRLQVLQGDTIAVWDRMFGPVYYFDPSGKLLKERRIDFGALIEATRTDGLHPGESVHWPLPDGSFLVDAIPSDWRPPAEPGQLYRRPTGYVRIDSAYSAHSLGWWDGRERLSTGLENLPSGVPFPAQAMTVAGGDPPSVYVTNGDRYEVHQFSMSGVLRRILRRTVDAIAITNDEIEEWKATFQAWNPNRDWRRWERVMGGLSRRYHPAISGFTVDSEGFLWTRRDRGNRRLGTTERSVFDADGRWLGTIPLPFEGIYWVGEDFILGGQVDFDTGLQTVERYRLDRRGRP